MFLIRAKTKEGTEKLKELFLKNQSRKARLVMSMSIVEQEPYTINFRFRTVSDKLLSNETIRNTLFNGLKEQIEKEYNLKAEDYEIQ